MLIGLSVGPHKFARILGHCLDHITFSVASRDEQRALNIPEKFCATEDRNCLLFDEKIKRFASMPPLEALPGDTVKTDLNADPKPLESLDKLPVTGEVFQSTEDVGIAAKVDHVSQLARDMMMSETGFPQRSKALLVEDNKINMKVK